LLPSEGDGDGGSHEEEYDDGNDEDTNDDVNTETCICNKKNPNERTITAANIIMRDCLKRRRSAAPVVLVPVRTPVAAADVNMFFF